MSISYKWLSKEHMKQVVMVHRESFSEQSISYTIFASPRIHKYLEALVQHLSFQPQNFFLGAWANQKLVGYAHYRILNKALHLNQIAVIPSYQGQGIGSKLLEEWLKKAIELGMTKLSLDVSRNNKKAQQLYNTWGLYECGQTWIYKISPKFLATEKVEKNEDHLSILDWENTLAWWETYGFAKILLNFKGRLVEVGWINNTIRLQDTFPKEILGNLPQIVPKIDNLFILSSKKMPDLFTLEPLKLVDTVIRMERYIDER